MNPGTESDGVSKAPRPRSNLSAALAENRRRREAAHTESIAAEAELGELLLEAHQCNLRLSTLATSTGLGKRTLRRMLPAIGDGEATKVQ